MTIKTNIVQSMPKLSSAWVFADKYYMTPTQQYRDNYDRIFGKKEEPKKEEVIEGDPGDEHEDKDVPPAATN